MSSAPSKAQDWSEAAAVEGPRRCDIDAVVTASMSHRVDVEPESAGSVGSSGRKWRWWAFGTVITAAVMDLLDSTITQVAAPTIRHDLGGSYAVIEWVTAAYALAMATGLLTGGRLGDTFGPAGGHLRRAAGAAGRDGGVRGRLGRVRGGGHRRRADRGPGGAGGAGRDH